ncbi:hypothetical protein CRG98_020847 [Punica granatum]|uniref:G-patch domain-containing protein n=1 Tax=Punica granatum TaxID=22663 RepID=A0A2I0JR58_PUNGR|nr:hypothetical protein CRG98_020847 [Punica granatum]
MEGPAVLSKLHAHTTRCPHLYSTGAAIPTSTPAQLIYCSAPPSPLPLVASSPIVHHYTSAPLQAPQYRPPASRAPQPTQQVPPPQGQQGGAAQPRPRRQYPSLPVPLSHIYQQLCAGDKIGTIAPGPNFDPTTQDQSKHYNICALREDDNEYDGPSPFVIEYIPTEATVGFTKLDTSPTPFVIDVPAREPYLDSKVSWTFEGDVGSLQHLFSIMGVTRSGQVYENPKVVSKGKAPAATIRTMPDVAPIPSKEVTEEEAEAFMKIIKASEYKVVEQMAKSPAHISLLALLLSSEPHREALLWVLTAAQVPKETAPDMIEETVGSIFSNTISFLDDELPSEGWAHSRVLHIVCKCNNYITGRVMIDNGSALNVCPVTTLKQMNVDIRPSKIVVRAFDGSRKEDYGEVGLSHADRMIGKVLLRHNYIPGYLNRPVEVEEYKNRRGLGFRPSCHEIIEAHKGNHLHRLAAHYGKLNGGIPVPPLSHFFLGPPHIIESTLNGPSSDSDDALAALPAVYTVTEEIPSRIHIRLVQENEELDNWTSVPRYSAVIADVQGLSMYKMFPACRHSHRPHDGRGISVVVSRSYYQ